LDVTSNAIFRDDVSILGDVKYRDELSFPKFVHDEEQIKGPAYLLLCEAATKNKTFGQIRDTSSFLVDVMDTDMIVYSKHPKISLVSCTFEGKDYIAIFWKEETIVPTPLYFTGSGDSILKWIKYGITDEKPLNKTDSYDVYFENANIRTGIGKLGINLQNETYPRAYLDVNGNTEIRSNLLVRDNVEFQGGGLYSVMDNVDGSSTKGIRLKDIHNDEWGIYLASIHGLSMKDKKTSIGHDFQGLALRNRSLNNPDSGFIWENSDESLLMSLNANTGKLYVRDQVVVKDGDAKLPGFAFSKRKNTGMFRTIEDELAFTIKGEERLKLKPNNIATLYGGLEVNKSLYMNSDDNNDGIYSSEGVYITAKEGNVQFKNVNRNPEWSVKNTEGKSLFSVSNLDSSVYTNLNILDDGRGNMNIANNLNVQGTISTQLGGLYSVMNNSIDSTKNGIRMNAINDDSWSMYLSKSIGGLTPGDKTPINGYDTLTDLSFRTRAKNSITNGFIWENDDEELLMSLNSGDAKLYVKNKVLSSTQENPSFTFHNNESTGLGSKNTDHISLFTSGKSHMTMLPDGNTGFGTDYPTHKLHVDGDVRVTDNIDLTSDKADKGIYSSDEQGLYLNAPNLDLKFKDSAKTDHIWNVLSKNDDKILSLYNVSNKIETKHNLLDSGTGDLSVYSDFDAVHNKFRIRESPTHLNVSMKHEYRSFKPYKTLCFMIFYDIQI
jgi:hypothetical protein